MGDRPTCLLPKLCNCGRVKNYSAAHRSNCFAPLVSRAASLGLRELKHANQSPPCRIRSEPEWPAPPLWPSLLAGATILRPDVAAAGSARDAPAPMPRIIGLPGLRASLCPTSRPRSGRARTYPVRENGGFYAAYGDPGLLPIAVSVRLGGESHRNAIGQLLFGARTTFILRTAAPLLDQPRPVASLGVPRQPMAELYGATVTRDDRAATTAYRFPLTASVWEFAGRPRAGSNPQIACLYFSR